MSTLGQPYFTIYLSLSCQMSSREDSLLSPRHTRCQASHILLYTVEALTRQNISSPFDMSFAHPMKQDLGCGGRLSISVFLRFDTIITTLIREEQGIRQIICGVVGLMYGHHGVINDVGNKDTIMRHARHFALRMRSYGLLNNYQIPY